MIWRPTSCKQNSRMRRNFRKRPEPYKGIEKIMLTAFTPVLAFVLQEATGTRSTMMWQSAKNPDLSKFLVIAALLFIIGVAV